MIGTVRSLADRLLERLVPATQAGAAPCTEYWTVEPCYTNSSLPYATSSSMKKFRKCGSTVTLLETRPCGTSVCGGYGRYGDFTPWYPCPCVPGPYNTCP